MRREEMEALTKQEILELARKLDIQGRSSLSKDGLIEALMKAQARARKPPFARRKPTRKAGVKAKVKAKVRAGVKAKVKAKVKAGVKAKGKTMAKARDKTASRAKTRTPVSAKARVQTRPSGARATAAKRRAAPRRSPASGKPAASRGPSVPRASRPTPATERATRKTAPPERARVSREKAPPRPVGTPLRIPEHYDKDFAALLVRDPYWLYAYWEVTQKSTDKLQRKLAAEWKGHRSVLRIYSYSQEVPPSKAEKGNGKDSYDIDLPAGATNWYINVGRPDRAYRVSVGILSRSGKFYALARSNVVVTPRDSISPVTDEEWTAAPETFRRLYDMASADQRGRSSAELGMLLRERLRADWSSGMLASMGSGALGKDRAEERGFWFVLDTELMVYGATESDATVTIQGRPVKLRPDGTFSLRFQLPDGTQVIDATAVSSDGTFRKTITPTVRRETRSTETVETQAGL